MRKKQKKALGLLGLSAVVGITAVAANLPTPAGAAASVSDTITVTVIDGRPGVAIINIKDGVVLTNSVVNAKFDYTNLQTLKVKLVYDDGGRARSLVERELKTFNFDFDHRSGSVSVSFDLNDYRGYGDYTIALEGTGFGATVQTAANFRYTGASIGGVGTETDKDGNITGSDIPVDESTGDPVIDVDVSEGTDKVVINVYEKDTNKLVLGPIETDGKGPITLPFDEKDLGSGDYIIVITGLDKDGNPTGEPIKVIYVHNGSTEGGDIEKDTNTGNPVVNVPTPGKGNHIVITVYDKETGKPVIDGITVTEGGNVTLPFVENGVDMGKYNIVITEYDGSGKVVGTPSRVSYSYVPGVPKTGNQTLALNLSRADYLLTGIIIFGIATIAAGAILAKKKHRR